MDHASGNLTEESTEEFSDTDSSASRSGFVVLGSKQKSTPSGARRVPVAELLEEERRVRTPGANFSLASDCSVPLPTGRRGELHVSFPAHPARVVDRDKNTSGNDVYVAPVYDPQCSETIRTTSTDVFSKGNGSNDSTALPFLVHLKDVLKLKDQTVEELEKSGFEEEEDLFVLKRVSDYPKNLSFITCLRDNLTIEDYINQCHPSRDSEHDFAPQATNPPVNDLSTMVSGAPGTSASSTADMPEIRIPHGGRTPLELPTIDRKGASAPGRQQPQKESHQADRPTAQTERSMSFLMEMHEFLGLQNGSVMELADAGYDNVDDLLALHKSNVFPRNLNFITHVRDRFAVADHVEKLTGPSPQSMRESTRGEKADIPQADPFSQELKEAAVISKGAQEPPITPLAFRLKELLGLADSSVAQLVNAGYDNTDDLYKLGKSNQFPKNLKFITRHRDRTALETYIMEAKLLEQDVMIVAGTSISGKQGDGDGRPQMERPSPKADAHGVAASAHGVPKPTGVADVIVPASAPGSGAACSEAERTDELVKIPEGSLARRLVLGKNVALGDLYNIREDCLLPQMSRGSPRQGTVFAETFNRIFCKVTTSDSITNNLTLSGVKDEETAKDVIAPWSPEQALSTLSGLTSPGEALKLLIGAKAGPRVVRGFLQYNLLRKRETMSLDHEEVGNVLRRATNTNATHVVIGIVGGCSGLCMVESNANVDQAEFRGRLEEELHRMATALVGTSGSFFKSTCVDALASSNESFSKKARLEGIQTIQLAINNNLVQPRLKHLADVAEKLGAISRNLDTGMDDRGVAMEMVLAPLSLLHQMASPNAPGVFYTSTVVADNVAMGCIEVFDLLLRTKEQVADLAKTFQKNSSAFTAREISELKDKWSSDLEAAEELMRNRLGNILVKARSRALSPDELLKLLERFVSGPFEYGAKKFSLTRLRKYLADQTHVEGKVTLLTDLKALGVKYLGRQDSLDAFVRQNGARKLYVFFHMNTMQQQDHDLWQETWDKFECFAKMDTETPPEQQASFASVDCDLLHMPHVTRTSVAMYSGGQLLSENVLEEGMDETNVCFAKSTSYEKQGKVGTPRCCIELPCPGSAGTGRCPAQPFTWHCAVCLEALQYCFDAFYYCGCGRARPDTFGYRCGALSHGDDFISYPGHRLRDLLGKLQPTKELNILILGETGVGKSTWINGFVNYVTYSSLEDAKEGKPVYLIPARFTSVNEKYEAVVVKMDSLDQKDNEVTAAAEEKFDVGKSCTQYAKSYTFPGKKTLIRLIDTPGIGDTSGADVDEQNFKNILDHISRLKELHGICILLKPNNARLTVMFQFCIKQLLTHLHKDAARNIVFVFTNCRSTFYKPGDSFPSLKKLLDGVESVDIPLSLDTMYCMDNEPVRFLAAVQNGIKFNDNDMENFSVSWLKSVKETGRLLSYIATLSPHKTHGTLSLNEARRIIMLLVKPMADIANNIQHNIDLANDHKQELASNRLSREDLLKRRFVPVVVLEARELPFPRTVCAGKNCIETHGNITKFVKHCHPHCYLNGVEVEKYPNPALKECKAMQSSQGVTCSVCGCIWEVHLHVRYEQVEVTIQQEDILIRDMLAGKEGAIETAQAMICNVDERIRQLDDEARRIAQVSSKFAYFLKTNAITAYNDSMDEYLTYMIRLEDEKIAKGGSRDKLEGYETMRARYHQEREILAKEMQSGCVSGRVAGD